MSEHLVRLAQAGDLDALLARMDDVPEEDRDEAAYKWLNVAVDFGHAEADERIADLMEGSSLRFDDDQFLTGNVHDKEGDQTLCPGCGTAVISRDWYEILDTRLTPKGACAKCGTQIPGRFAEAIGNFGRKRMRVLV